MSGRKELPEATDASVNEDAPLWNEINSLAEELEFVSDANIAKNRWIAAYFRLFLPAGEAREVIREARERMTEDEFVENFKSILSCETTANSPADFLSILSKYRHLCCPDASLNDYIRTFSNHMSKDPLAFFYELVQNADDDKYADNEPSFEIDLTDDIIMVRYNEIGMNPADIFAICSAGESNKGPEAIGEKGVGFKTVFAVCDRVDIVSGGYSFSLIDGGFHIDTFVPGENSGKGTTMLLHIKKEAEITADTLYNALRKQYGINGGKNAVFSKCPVMYTQKLRSITVRCGEDCFSVSKEDYQSANDTVSFTINVSSNGQKTASIPCFGIFRDVTLSPDAVESRYSDTGTAKNSNQRIEIIAALDKEVTEGNMYSFLPCGQTIKAPFCVQLPVKLNIDRTRMFFDGDADTKNPNTVKPIGAESPSTIEWNEALVTAFIDMLPRFYEALGEKNAPYRYIPDISDGELFRLPCDENYMNTYCNKLGLITTLKSIPYFKAAGAKEYCSAEEAVLFDEFICKFSAEWADILKRGNILNKSRKPIEYSEEILAYGKRVGLEKFSYGDKDMTGYFNTLMEKAPVSRERVFSALYLENTNGKEYDILENVDKSKLNLFPARLTDKGTEYITQYGVWFCSDTFTSRNCFFHFMPSGCRELYEKAGIEILPADSVEDVLSGLLEKTTNGEPKPDAYYLKYLCEFLYDNSSTDIRNIETYCCQFVQQRTREAMLFGELVMGTEKTRYTALKSAAEDYWQSGKVFDDDNPITADNFDDYEHLLKLLAESVFNSVKCSRDDSDAENTNSNEPALELLQNADDSKRRNPADNIGNDFSADHNSSTVTLSYSEAGFSLWDFYCITGRGNSGNYSAKTNTGKFGSGFKSIYTICTAVEIISHGVKCILDTEPFDIAKRTWLENHRSFYDALNLNDAGKKRFKSSPVPLFVKADAYSEKTEIILHFNSCSGAEDFFRKLMAPENYVFLKNLDYPENEYPYPRDNGEGKGFYFCPKTPEGEMPLFEMYFPLPYNGTEYPLYCGLPMNGTSVLPFMLNIPHIHPTEDRRSINVIGTHQKPNLDYLKKVLNGSNVAFEDFEGIGDGFKAFAKEHPDTAYKFIPANGIEIELDAHNALRASKLDSWSIYPYKKQGKIVGCASKKDITPTLLPRRKQTDIKVFSDSLYSCLAPEEINEGLLNENLLYIDSEIKELLEIANERSYFTVLDKIFPDGKPSVDDCGFINACLPYLRKELYRFDEAVSNQTGDGKNPQTPTEITCDPLVNLIKGYCGKKYCEYEALAKFNDEPRAQEYFSMGLVAFETVSGYRVFSEEEKFYCANNADICSYLEDYKTKPGFERVIIDRAIIGYKDINILNLKNLFHVNYMTETEAFFKSENYWLTEFALRWNGVNSCSNPAFDYLCELFESADKKEQEKYCKLLKFVLCNDRTKAEKNIPDFIKKLMDKNFPPKYYGILTDLLKGNKSSLSPECIAGLIGYIPKGDDKYITWLNEIIGDYSVNDTIAEDAEKNLTAPLKEQLEEQKHSPNREKLSGLKPYFNLLFIIMSRRESISYDTLNTLLDYTEIFLNEQEQEFADKIIQALKNWEMYKKEQLSGLAGIYIASENKDIFDLLIKNLQREEAEIHEVTDQLGKLIDKLSGDGSTEQLKALKEALKDVDIDITAARYIKMESKPKGSVFSGDKLWLSNALTDEKLISEAKNQAAKLLGDEEAVKAALIGTFECEGYEFSGYGTEKKCPVCGGTVLAEASVLQVKRISNNIPLLMCRNCSEFVDAYTSGVSVNLNPKAANKAELVFRGFEKKSVTVNITFLHRMMMD